MTACKWKSKGTSYQAWRVSTHRYQWSYGGWFSLKGMRYIVCFIDDATRYGVVYLMENKFKVLDCFKLYIDYMRVRQVTIGSG